MTKVTIRPLAENDLLSIAIFIAQDNPQRAKSFLQELETQIDTLSKFPERSQICKAIGEDIRQMSYKKYRIFYRFEHTEDTVHVLRVIAPFLSVDNLPLGEKT